MSKLDKLKEIIRELIRKELSEASTTSNVAGYATPMAFSGGRKKDKKKRHQMDLILRTIDSYNFLETH